MPDKTDTIGGYKKLLSFFIIIILLTTGVMLLGSSQIIKDVESRWQRFFYDFRLTLPIQPTQHQYPIYLVELDDRSLPGNTCRSPVSKDWLANVLVLISKQSPKIVGLNLLLQESDPVSDNTLAGVIDSMGNVVILDSPKSPSAKKFKSAARSWGSMIYRTNSAGDVQYACSSVGISDCVGVGNPQNRRIFFKELLKGIDLEYDFLTLPAENGWLKLFFSFAPDSIRQPFGYKPWTTISAHKLAAIPPASLPKNAVYLIGTKFSGLYQEYSLPARSTTKIPGQGSTKQVTNLELVALVLDMALNKTFLQTMSPWLTGLLLIVLLGLIATISWNNYSFLHFWLAVFLAIVWNLTAALSFSYYLRDLQCFLPSLSLPLFSLYCLRHQQIFAKFERYELNYQLEKERFNGLVDRFHSHSVFNALEHIRYLVRRNDQGVDRYILDYSTLLLDDLRHQPQQWYPLPEQWDYTINYLQLQNMKLDNKIKLDFDLPSSTESKMTGLQLPWKLFFPLAENAFKYTKAAMDSQQEPKPFIKVQLSINQSALIFTISNSFSNSESAAGTRQGINNLKRRISLLFPGEKWQLEQSGIDSVWISSLNLPLKFEKNNEV